MSYIHKWTHEEDDYLLLAHKNGISKTRMAKRIGIHRETVRRRLGYLREAQAELAKAEAIDLRSEHACRMKWERLENREPSPFVLWATGMLRLVHGKSPES